MNVAFVLCMLFICQLITIIIIIIIIIIINNYHHHHGLVNGEGQTRK